MLETFRTRAGSWDRRAPGRDRGAPLRAPTAALLAIALFAVGPGPARGADGVRLRYTLKSGAAYDQTVSGTLNIVPQPEGVPPLLMQMLRSMTGEMKQEISLKGRIDVGSPAAGDKSTPLTYKVVDAKALLTRAGETHDLTSSMAIPKDRPAAGRVTADGLRVEFDAAAAGTALPARMQEHVAANFPGLPARDLHVGESFDVPMPTTVPGPGGKETRVDGHGTYTLRQVSSREALFDIRESIAPTQPIDLNEGRSLMIEGKAVGQATFSMAEGAFTSITMSSDYDMTVVFPLPPGLSLDGLTEGGAAGSAAGANGATGTPAANTLTMHVKVNGPITMTLARAAAR